ncbi:MAG TPA: FAD-binding oxidoreductase [Mycobacteriales bacterium]|jgi:glycolate oxidase FAD binding subunit|nr:FAD-binding oxidoreductase [Mycobacteriales bacterium]
MQDSVRPTSVEELAAVLRDGDGTVRVRGSGSKWSWGASAADPDLVVDLTAMDRVVEHAAGDLVVTVQAGASLTDLQAALGTAGQWLALDPPDDGATVGGVVATATSGPRRLRFGTPRDLLIGITVVLADGTVARSGGKVVKNVAGYDLGKLFSGSFGTLGVIAECTFRLHPVAPARRVVSVDAADPGGLVREVLRSPLEPVALEWDGVRLHAVFETVEAAADTQARALLALAGAGEVTDALPEAFGARPWDHGQLAMKVTHRISALSAVLDVVRRQLPGCRLAAHAGSGVLYAGVSADAADIIGAVDQLRRDVAVHDGSVVVVDAPQQVKDQLDVWGPVPGIDVMRRVKAQFDPDGRMSPGRFVGGI